MIINNFTTSKIHNKQTKEGIAMKQIHRILSSWLICCLMLAMMPVQVFAAEETATEPPAETVVETVTEIPEETVTDPAEETVAETAAEPTEETVAETVAESAEESFQTEETVSEEAVNATATKNEAWIQQQIDDGVTEIYIDDAIVLENDFAIESRVRLYIRYGSITVPAGRTLTVSGPQINIWEEGSIIVERGGCLVNRSEIKVAGTLVVYGTFEGVIHTYHWDKETVRIIGVPNSAIWMHYVVQEGNSDANQAKFLENWALMESSNYYAYSQQIHGSMTLPGDLVIPANCWIVLENENLTFTIPQGVKVTNHGSLKSFANQTVVNYGTFENLGYLELYGSWIGNQPVAPTNESWIQEQINAGKTEFALESDIVLKNDFVLPQGVFLQFNGHTITVPDGKTMTVRGQLGYWWEQGGLIVESGGSLINNGFIGSAGILDIRGSFSGNYIHTCYVLGGMHATITGLADEDIWMHYVVDNGGANVEHQDIFLEYLDLMNSTDYGWYSFQVHGKLTLPCDLLIPANCCFFLESQSFTMTIPAGRKITNYGEFYTYEDQTVANYGTFENAGYMNVQGKWIGNQPVKLQMSQDQLEQFLVQSDYYNLNAEVTLERDMTLTTHLYIRPGAKVVVPKGVKLTVENNITVVWGGTLDIQGDYELIPTEDGHRSIGLCLEDGTYSTVKGVDPRDMSLNCIVQNTAELMHAMELADAGAYSWYFTYIYEDVTFTKNVSLNASVEVYNQATVTVPRNVTVTIPAGQFMTCTEGTTLINEGTVQDQGELTFYDQATLNNKGTVQVDGILVNYGGVVNYGTVNYSAEGLLVDKGFWEGNQPIIAHKHDYKAVVTAPTCTEEGYTTHTCDCGDTYTDSQVDALGHTEVIDTAGTKPTCVEAGVSDGTHCSVCSEVLAVPSPLEPTGIHDYVNGTCAYCGQEKFELIDVDSDGVIGEKDALRLLWHALFPSEQSIPGWGDVTGDGKATEEDAVYVIWYTLFPTLYPI